MMRFAIAVALSSFCVVGVGHASPDTSRKPSAKAQRRHRTAKDEPPKSEEEKLADKINRCNDGNDPLCGTGM